MNVYENGAADTRQSEDAAPPPSLFRKRYKQLAAHEVALHDAIKDKADDLARTFCKVLSGQTVGPDRSQNLLNSLAANRGANVTLALRHLEDAVYRAVKALTT